MHIKLPTLISIDSALAEATAVASRGRRREIEARIGQSRRMGCSSHSHGYSSLSS